MPETLPQLPSGSTRSHEPDRPRLRRTGLRGSWRLVAVLGVVALGLAACGSDSSAGLTVNSNTVDESTINDQLNVIATNKDLKAQVAVDGKIKPDAAATWITQLVPMAVAKEVVDKAGTKITQADRLGATEWANGVFGDDAFAKFKKSFVDDVIARYAAIPAYVRTHTKAPTTAQLQQAYDSGIQENCPSRRYVSQILVATEQAAKDVAARLAAGEDFRTVARVTSTDTQTASSGGAYGCIEALQSAPTFADAAAATAVGQTSAPVQLLDGWHIIKVQDVGEVVSFDSAKQEIEKQLRDQEGKGKLAKLVLKAKVKVAAKYGTWVIKDNQGRVEPPASKSSTSSTTSTTSSSSSSTPTSTP